MLADRSTGWKSQWRLDMEARRAQEATARPHKRVVDSVSRKDAPPIAKQRGPKRELQTVSRQLRWQQRQIDLGNCRNCGNTRDGESLTQCNQCLKENAARQRGRATKVATDNPPHPS